MTHQLKAFHSFCFSTSVFPVITYRKTATDKAFEN